MDKIWYIVSDGRPEGPYSLSELKKERQITPDTFVWKEGFEQWKRARDVPELKVLFRGHGEEEQEEPSANTQKLPPQDELAIEIGGPPNLFWILLAMILIVYLIAQLFWG